MSKKLLIFGDGEIADLAFFYFSKKSDYNISAFIVDDPKQEKFKYPKEKVLSKRVKSFIVDYKDSLILDIWIFLFSEIKGDSDTIMGLPVKKIKEYLKNLN